MQSLAPFSTGYIENQDDTTDNVFMDRSSNPDSIRMKFSGDVDIDTIGKSASVEVEDKSKIIFFPVQRPGETREKELQWWIGKITEIQENCFKAILEDLSGRINFVEFDNEFVSQRDRDLLFVGSRFTYSVSVIYTGVGSTEYKTKMAFDYRRRWLEEYNKNFEKVAEEIFPENLLDL